MAKDKQTKASPAEPAAAKEKPVEKLKEHKLLAKMRANPRDWQIGDINTICNSLGIKLRPGAKHYVACSEHLIGALTIPAKRPIKAFYIKSFIAMCDAHIHATNGEA